MYWGEKAGRISEVIIEALKISQGWDKDWGGMPQVNDFHIRLL